MMKRNELIEKLGYLGFPLFTTEKNVNASEVLAEVIRSNDPRLIESFPVVFANCNEKGLCNYDDLKNQLSSNAEKAKLSMMIAVSLAMYKYYNLKFFWAKEYQKILSSTVAENGNYYLKYLKNDRNIVLNSHKLSAQRLKNTFRNYYTGSQPKVKDVISQKDEFDLEFALSQVFSPKQKELFLKKINGKKLTKTEKEYYSRTVKKKVIALSNDTLNNMAKKLLD